MESWREVRDLLEEEPSAAGADCPSLDAERSSGGTALLPLAELVFDLV